MFEVSGARAPLGGFLLRDLDVGIGDGLLHRRRQLRRTSLLRRLARVNACQAPSVRCGDVKGAKDTLRDHTMAGRTTLTTCRISAVAIALNIAFEFVGDAGSTQGSAKDQALSGPIASSNGWRTVKSGRLPI